MSREQPSVYTQEFKITAVQRMTNGENVSALAMELGVLRKSLYAWRDQLRMGEPESLQQHRRGPKPKRFADDNSTVEVVLEMSPHGVVPPRAVGAPLERPPVSVESTLLTTAQLRIAELEQKIGRQALELDFFHAALQHIGALHQLNTRLGVMASMRSSER